MRQEPHPLHESGSNGIPLPARDLRRQRHKEFVYSLSRQKLSKQCWPTLVEERSYPKLQAQQSQNRLRTDAATTRIQSLNLNGS